jgi:transcriptional regulator with XRE-family HTH domain
MFGERLKQLRTEKELMQKDLAKIIGVSDRTIGMYEQERREPDFNTINKLADYFNCTTDYLFGRVEQRTFKVHKQNIEGHEIEYSLDRDKYPDGLTHEEVLEVLENFKKMGMDFSKFKKD